MSEFVKSDYYRKSVDELLEDSTFRAGVANIVQNPSKETDKFIKGDLTSSGNKK